MTRRTLLSVVSPCLWLAASLAGCTSKSLTPAGDPNAVSYYKDVKPLVESKCITCHNVGGVAPFKLTDYADLVEHRMAIRVAVASRIMPPWLAGKGCNDYAFDRSLSDAQIATITKWVDGGTLEGKAADYVAPAAEPTGGLSRVDRTLTMAAPYTPTLSPDEYRCFLIDWPESNDTFVTGFRANPGAKSIVHHVIAFLAPPAQVAAYQKLDDDDPAPGYVCFGGPGGTGQGAAAEWVGSWAPGSQGYDFAPSTGIKIPKGSKVVLQVHYHTDNAPPTADQTSLDFKVDQTVKTEAFQIPWTSYQWAIQHQMPIPAGNPDVMHSYSFDVSTVLSFLTGGVLKDNQPFTIYGTGFHMHTRGTHGRVDLQRATGDKECLIDVPRWDFHWQGSYGFAQPKVVNPGDQIYLECHWDNSMGPTDMNWGEGTGDEMCLTGFYVTQ